MSLSNNEKIINILKKNGPLLSPEITQKLQFQYRLTPQSAKKALTRILNPIKKIEGINFPHNQKFFYLKELGYNAKNKFQKYCNKHNTAEGLILNALISHDGMCLAKYLPIISGLPNKTASNQKSFKDAVSSLERIEMIQKDQDNETGEEFYFLFKKEDRSYSKSRFYLDLEDMILEHLKKLFVNLNFSSSEAITIRTKKEIPFYGSYSWSLVGPCYLDGIKMGNTNGHICCDIFLGGRLDRNNIKPILRKYNTTKAQNRNTRLIPAIFFQSMTTPLLMELRKKGFLTISAKTFGGNELLILLENLRSLYENINKKTNSLNKVSKIIIDMSKHLGSRANNIKGYLFNIMAKSLFDLNYTNVEMGKKIQHNHQKKEVDVYFEDQKYRYIVETKAWANFRNKNQKITDWMSKKYDFFVEWNKSEREKKLKIYFIIACKDQAEIDNLNKKHKNKEHLTFYDRTFLHEIAVRHKKKEAREALKHFF